MPNKKFFVICKRSKESGTLYHVLCADLGYRVLNISMDKAIICELCDIRFSELANLCEGEILEVNL